MAGYAIRVEEDGGECRWVRAEVAESCTLGRLAQWLEKEFTLAPGGWSFTLAGRRPGEDASFTGPGDDVARPGEELALGALAWRPGLRWVHRSQASPFRVREILVEARAASLGGDLRELERGARGRTGGFDSERMAARSAQAAGDWARELEDERAPDADELRERSALALEVARWIGRDAERQAALELLADGDGLLWLLDLPSSLSEAGEHAAALELCEALAFVRGEGETRAERPFLLARAGRADAARAEAERWLAEAPEDAWARLFTSDLFALVGEGKLARAGLALAAALAPDDLELQVAVAERLLTLAREAGDGRSVADLERRLEAYQVALDEQAERESELDEPFADDSSEDSAQASSVGPNEPCPCGSGMKFKRCCGSGTGAPQGDAAQVVGLLEELAREADSPKLARVLQDALPRFAGETLAGFGLGAALPLLPRDDLPEALVHWAVLDCDLGDGTRVIERVLRRRKRAGARERELFGLLADSAPSAWRVELLADGRDARLLDLLDAAADPILLGGVEGLPHGAILCARVLELDGEPAIGPGAIVLEGGSAETWLATVRARLHELRAADPELEWRAFLRRHAHEFYRPLMEG